MDMKSDVDPQETREWQDAIDGVIDHEGAERAHFLIEQVIDKSRRRGAYVPFSANTAYINTIPAALIDQNAVGAPRAPLREDQIAGEVFLEDGDGVHCLERQRDFYTILLRRKRPGWTLRSAHAGIGV